MQVIARFLGLLNLYRNKAVAFDQDEPMGPLTVRWTGEADGDGAAWMIRVADDEFDVVVDDAIDGAAVGEEEDR
jgi:segregation and condensation protein A